MIVWDCDKEGRQAVAKRVLPAMRTAVRNGDILSVKVVWLFDDSKNKDLKDFTDFIVKAGGSGQDLLDMIARAKPEEFPLPSTDLPEPVVLSSFVQVDDHKYVGQRVTLPIYVYGENSETYHAPTQVTVGECPGKKRFGCSGRADWGWSCDEPIPIKIGDRVQLTCVATSDFQLKGYLRDFVCDKGERPILTLEDRNRITIRELFAHQVMAGDAADTTELVEKPVYTIGGQNYPIGQYQATGFIHSHPRNQKPTMLIDTMEPQEEDWQAFDLDRARPLLRQLQAAEHRRVFRRSDVQPHQDLFTL